MILHFFRISVFSCDKDESALNQFLSQHKVVSIDKQFVTDGANSFWSICVTIADVQERFSHNTKSKRKAIDYRDISRSHAPAWECIS